MSTFFDEVQELRARYPDERSAVMPALQLAQERHGGQSPRGLVAGRLDQQAEQRGSGGPAGECARLHDAGGGAGCLSSDPDHGVEQQPGPGPAQRERDQTGRYDGHR